MRYNILLYGATGYSGQLIAAEGKASGMSDLGSVSECRMILAARGSSKLREIARKNCMSFRSFGLTDLNEVTHNLDDISVIINAAGPFAFTAETLAKAALEVGCHYTDISGEIDLYRHLDYLGRAAAQRNVAIVSAAGHTAASSDILLDVALQQLLQQGIITRGNELGAVRIALSSIGNFSRGSMRTLARSLREQVIVVRKGMAEGALEEQMLIWHEPVGKLERLFDFDSLVEGSRIEQRQCSTHIASAANLIDTLAAQFTVERHHLSARTIESYVQMGRAARLGFQLGAVCASLSTLPLIQRLMQAQLSLLSDGPAHKNIQHERNVIIIEIEDSYRTRLIDWWWETPNAYQFSAQLVVAVARAIVTANKVGWVTPADALAMDLPSLERAAGALRNTRLERRIIK